MRSIILFITLCSVYCADELIAEKDIQSYVDQFNAIAKESDPKIFIPSSLKIIHPDSPFAVMLKRIDLSKPTPANVKYGNKPKILKFEIIITGTNKTAVLTEEEGNKSNIIVFQRDASDNGIVKWLNVVQY
jgi:hypothetical protein